jgi:hypothetical protein
MATTSNSASDADNVLLDSAAMSHMFRKHLTFTNYRPSMENETISVENKHPLQVAGRGSIKIQFSLKNHTHTIVLHNVLHVPHLASNLISLGTLQHKGVTYHNLEGRLIVTLRGDELVRATLSRSLYHINCTLFHPTCNTHPDAASSGSWREYLGCEHLNAISQAKQHHKTKGLTFMSD